MLLHWSRYRRLSAPWAKFRTAAWSPSLRSTARRRGPQDQPDYLNAAVALETALPPETLLDHTQRIELQQGRVRKAERWGPRTLDLDIMLFGDAVINSERLTVPHYDMKNRGFMLWPLFEIAPDLHFPDGPALRAVLDNLGAAKPASW